jgi:hypothetical protein
VEPSSNNVQNFEILAKTSVSIIKFNTINRNATDNILKITLINKDLSTLDDLNYLFFSTLST